MCEGERAILLAEALVLKAEAKYFRDTTSKLEKAIAERDEAQMDICIDQIQKEKHRINPEQSFDHEELWVATGRWFSGKSKKLNSTS